MFLIFLILAIMWVKMDRLCEHQKRTPQWEYLVLYIGKQGYLKGEFDQLGEKGLEFVMCIPEVGLTKFIFKRLKNQNP